MRMKPMRGGAGRRALAAVIGDLHFLAGVGEVAVGAPRRNSPQWMAR